MRSEAITERILMGSVVVGSLAVFILAIHPLEFLMTDAAYYILLSRKFLQQGMGEILFYSKLAQGHFYFLIPAALTPFNLLGQEYLWAMRVIPLSAAAAALFLYSAFLKESLAQKMRLFLVLVFALNPWSIRYAGIVLTEMPFIAFLLGVLVLVRQYERTGRQAFLYAAVFLSGLSIYVRPPGFSLLCALILWLAVRKQRRQLGWSLILTGVLLIPLFLQRRFLWQTHLNGMFLDKDFYAASQQSMTALDLAYRMGYQTLVYLGQYMPDLFFKPVVEHIHPRLADRSINPVFAVKFIIGLCLSAVILKGYIVSARQGGMKVHHWFCLFYFPVLLLAGVYVARYLYVLLPLLLFFLSAGMRPCAGRVCRAFWIMLLATCVYGASLLILQARTGYLSPEERSFVSCNDWVKAHTPPEARVLSRKFAFTEVYTGRTSLPYCFSDDLDRQLRYIAERKVTHIIIGDLGFYLDSERIYKRLVSEYPQRFRLVHTTKREPYDYVYAVYP